MKPRLTVVGDIAIEMMMNIRAMPPHGAKSEEERYLFIPGGNAGNSALAASYIGADVQLCSRVGRDGNATRLVNFFEHSGIDTSAVFEDTEGQTGMLLHFREPDFDSSRCISYRGASEKLDGKDIDNALVAEPDMIFLSKEVPSKTALYAATAAQRMSIPVFVDASDARLLAALSGKELSVKVVYMHDSEVEAYIGMPARDVGSCLKCAISIEQRLRAKYYIIRVKNRGLFVYDGKFYNMAVASDMTEGVAKNGYADIEAAALAAEFLVHGNIGTACAIAELADKLAREDDNIRIPTLDNILKYARMKGANLNLGIK